MSREMRIHADITMVAMESKRGQETSEDLGKVRDSVRVRGSILRDPCRIKKFSELETCWKGYLERYEVVFRECGVRGEALKVAKLLLMTRLRHGHWGGG